MAVRNRRVARRDTWRWERDWAECWDAVLRHVDVTANNPLDLAEKLRNIAVALYEARQKKPWAEAKHG